MHEICMPHSIVADINFITTDVYIIIIIPLMNGIRNSKIIADMNFATERDSSIIILLFTLYDAYRNATMLQ